jgi:hypothetical protein
MLFKIILVFLLAMGLVGMIGKALFPGVLARRGKKLSPLAAKVICPKCGRYKIGKKGCGTDGCDSGGA